VLLKKDTEGTEAVGFKWWLVGWLGELLINFLFLFSRIHIIGYEPVADLIKTRRLIFVFWHSRILLPSYRYKKLGASIMVSNSADGEIVAQVIQRQGHSAIRGSTGKGGMRALIRQSNDMRMNGRPGVVIPDGPQGPRHKVQQGVILLAQKTKVPILPMAYSSSKRKVFKSWDRFILPFPWSEGVMIYGRPVHVPSKATPNDLAECTQALETELIRITSQADQFFGHEFEV
jgi:lysophospholipid acyltransferase (LPLAT)-like uncharacterized protein